MKREEGKEKTLLFLIAIVPRDPSLEEYASRFIFRFDEYKRIILGSIQESAI